MNIQEIQNGDFSSIAESGEMFGWEFDKDGLTGKDFGDRWCGVVDRINITAILVGGSIVQNQYSW